MDTNLPGQYPSGTSSDNQVIKNRQIERSSEAAGESFPPALDLRKTSRYIL
jgi:hypothetical protein